MRKLQESIFKTKSKRRTPTQEEVNEIIEEFIILKISDPLKSYLESGVEEYYFYHMTWLDLISIKIKIRKKLKVIKLYLNVTFFFRMIKESIEQINHKDKLHIDIDILYETPSLRFDLKKIREEKDIISTPCESIFKKNAEDIKIGDVFEDNGRHKVIDIKELVFNKDYDRYIISQGKLDELNLYKFNCKGFKERKYAIYDIDHGVEFLETLNILIKKHNGAVYLIVNFDGVSEYTLKDEEGAETMYSLKELSEEYFYLGENK